MTMCKVCSTLTSSRKPSIICSGPCSNEYHVSCIYSGSLDLLSLVNKIDGLSWKCAECTNTCLLINEVKLTEIIQSKVMNAVSQLSAQFELFKNEFFQKFPTANFPHTTLDQPAKYADIVRSKTEPVVIVKPKNPNQQNSQTKADIMQRINPVDSNIQLSKVKNVKNGGVVIGCKSLEENARFKKLAVEKLPSTYEVTEARGLNPRIRIVGIREKMDDDELLSIIHSMNNHLINNNSDLKLIKFYATRKNNNIYQAIIQLDKISYNRVIQAGNLFVGYDSCRVYDAIDIYRCYNCNEFHHSSKFCKNPCTCPRCGENHVVSNCKSPILKCVNCVSLKDKLKSDNISIDHASWDIHKCTAYIQARDKIRADLLLNQQ